MFLIQKTKLLQAWVVPYSSFPIQRLCWCPPMLYYGNYFFCERSPSWSTGPDKLKRRHSGAVIVSVSVKAMVIRSCNWCIKKLLWDQCLSSQWLITSWCSSGKSSFPLKKWMRYLRKEKNNNKKPQTLGNCICQTKSLLWSFAYPIDKTGLLFFSFFFPTLWIMVRG